MKIFVTRPIPESGLKQLRAHHEIIVHSDRVMSEKELIRFAKGADILVTLLTDTLSEKVMEAIGPQLKLIAQFAVGFDNIDLDAAQKRNIVVTNTPGVLSAAAVAEQVVNLMFSVARHTVPADHFMRTGQFRHWDPNLYLGLQLMGKKLGIIGTGQIGSLVAQICHRGLAMQVQYFDPRPNPALEKTTGAKLVTTEQLLIDSDVISIHVPLLKSTHHLLAASQFHLMKPTAILINTSRGPVMDERALVNALRQGHLYGAGLDVFEFEPKLAQGLAALPNVVVSPHISSATVETREAMADCVAENVLAVIKGKPAPNAVHQL